jgi:hypothetical protein
VPGSVIIGVGSKSSQFTDKLAKEIMMSGLKPPGLIAIGVYTEAHGDPTRKRIHRKADRLHIWDISVLPGSNPEGVNKELDDLVALQRKVVKFEPESVLLVIDAKYMNTPRFAGIFHMLRSTLPQNSKMSALCLIDDPVGERSAVETLQQFTAESPTTHNNPILDAVFIARTFDSPLASAVGGVSPQMDLLAKSMAQIWQANRYTNFNPTFNDQVKLMRQSGFTFIGLAIGSVGLSGDQEKRGFFAQFFQPKLSGSQTQHRLTQLAEDLLQSQPEPRTSVKPLDLDALAREHPITVNAIAPFRSTDPQFEEVRDGLLRALRGRKYNIAHISMIPGNGVPLKAKQQTQANENASTSNATSPNALGGYPSGANPQGVQRGYTPGDYQSNNVPPGYAPAGGYGSVSTDAPTITPQSRVSGALPPPPHPASSGGAAANAQRSDGAKQNGQTNASDKFIGQVCILFGIDPEQI